MRINSACDIGVHPRTSGARGYRCVDEHHCGIDSTMPAAKPAHTIATTRLRSAA